MTPATLSLQVQLLKAIGHPVRLRLLAMLRGGPLCVCQMTAVVGLAASTVSEHLAELRRADLVLERKEGRWVEYRLSDSARDESLLTAMWPLLEGDRDIAADAVLVRELRRVPVDELCGASLDVTRLDRPKLAAAATKAARLRKTVRS